MYVFTLYFNNNCFSLLYSSDTLHNIAAYLNLLPVLSKGESTTYSKDFLLQLLVALHERRPSQLESINNTPLYPTEEILWDESVVPYEYFDGEGTCVHVLYSNFHETFSSE